MATAPPRALLLASVLLAAGCAPLGLTRAPGQTPPAETRLDLVRAFLDRGWTTVPLAFTAPAGIVGQGTVYRVEGRTVAVYDYGSTEEADAAALDDARRLLRRTAGQGSTVYRRRSLVVVTYGRARTAFDLRLGRLLAGPALAAAPPEVAPAR